MAKIVHASAYANNEVALISWQVDEMIAGCLGFDIVRIRTDGAEAPKGLATWVPFPDQENPTWTPQDTGVWPIQKLFWRDLTLRRHRSDTGRREIGFTVKYSIRPVGRYDAALPSVPVRQPKAYSGAAVPLSYLGEARETNVITIDTDCGGVRATFTNGILSSQWLKHAIESAGEPFNVNTIRDEIGKADSPIRAYLTGDVLETVGLILTDPDFAHGKVRLALYELSDGELVDLLIKNKKRIEVILSNTSKDRGGTVWDATNKKSRARLKREGVKVHDRMFNNNHIGHNKFAVWLDGDTPAAVMSGSTNWTPTGLCGQSNNAFLIKSKSIAKAYDDYWMRLRDDAFPNPKPLTSPGHVEQRQGEEIRTEDQTPADATYAKGGKARIWFSPNTIAYRKGKDAPPDLAELFEAMASAKKMLLFLAFLPSRGGADSIISAAIAAGEAKAGLVVAGAISDPTAMPGYKPGDKTKNIEAVEPYTYDRGNIHIVRAAALADIVGAFEKEILKVGNAVVHDKIVVVDPLSDNCLVAAGSHNLGFKASYENDENLVLFRGNKALAQAYAVHVMDVYDHYRFRAWQAQAIAEGAPHFDGHLQLSDKWLRANLTGNKGDIARYFA
jgi:phosphatidylserine/phosphatidylglycerophosphate/cardiolipin synthase-like enzyme